MLHLEQQVDGGRPGASWNNPDDGTCCVGVPATAGGALVQESAWFGAALLHVSGVLRGVLIVLCAGVVFTMGGKKNGVEILGECVMVGMVEKNQTSQTLLVSPVSVPATTTQRM